MIELLVIEGWKLRKNAKKYRIIEDYHFLVLLNAINLRNHSNTFV